MKVPVIVKFFFAVSVSLGSGLLFWIFSFFAPQIPSGPYTIPPFPNLFLLLLFSIPFFLVFLLIPTQKIIIRFSIGWFIVLLIIIVLGSFDAAGRLGL